jgi:hypothetical protein
VWQGPSLASYKHCLTEPHNNPIKWVLLALVTDGETKVWNGDVTCSSSHSWLVMETHLSDSHGAGPLGPDGSHPTPGSFLYMVVCGVNLGFHGLAPELLKKS